MSRDLLIGEVAVARERERGPVHLTRLGAGNRHGNLLGEFASRRPGTSTSVATARGQHDLSSPSDVALVHARPPTSPQCARARRANALGLLASSRRSRRGRPFKSSSARAAVLPARASALRSSLEDERRHPLGATLAASATAERAIAAAAWESCDEPFKGIPQPRRPSTAVSTTPRARAAAAAAKKAPTASKDLRLASVRGQNERIIVARRDDDSYHYRISVCD